MVFNVVLDPEELAAMIDFFDSDRSGSVDGAEFASRFFRLSSDMRRARLDRERLEEAARKQKAKSVHEAIEDRYFRRTLATVADEYGDEDEISALAKIAKVARGTLTGATAPELRPFKEGAYLDATALRHYLRTCFRVKLTPEELAALMGILDMSGDGHIDGGEFLNSFYKIVRREQADHVHAKFDANVRRARSETALKQKYVDIYERTTRVKVVWPKKEKLDGTDDHASLGSAKTAGTVVSVSEDVADFLSDIDAQWNKAERQRKRRVRRATIL